MISYKNGPVADWQGVQGGKVIEFATNKPRHIKMSMIANGDAEVWVADNEEGAGATLLGCVDRKGVHRFECTVDGTSYVQIKAKKDVTVEVKTQDLDQTIETEEKPSFVNLEPRVGQNKELQLMQRLMELNNEKMQAQIASLQSKLAEQKSEPVPEAPIVDETPTEQVSDAPEEDNG
jgi:hypothetical protein